MTTIADLPAGQALATAHVPVHAALKSAVQAIEATLEGAVRDIRGYGATGSGDDSTAINAALDDGPGVVYVPPGTWYVDACLIIPSYVTLRGAGMGATTIKRLSIYGTESATDRTSSIVNFSDTPGNPVDAAIEDLTLDSDGAALITTTDDIYPGGWFDVYLLGTRSRLSRVKLKGSPAYGICMGGENVTIDGCVIEGHAAGDIYRDIVSISQHPTAPVVTTLTDHDLVTGQDIRFAGNNSTGVANSTSYTITKTGARTFTVSANCTVAGTATGKVGIQDGPMRYGIWGASTADRGHRVLDTIVHDCYWGGIALGGEQTQVSRCHLYDNHQMATNTGGGQLHLVHSNAGGGTSHGHEITETLIECTSDHPASSTGTSGIEPNSDDILIIGNRIEGIPHYGIVLQDTADTNIRIVGNQIRDCGQGIFVSPNVPDFSIVGNTITGCDTYGIYISTGTSDRFLIVGNNLSGNGTDLSNGATGTSTWVVANTGTDGSSGTWTPGLTFNGAATGITYSAQTGSWVKVGPLVFVTLRITLTNKGSSTGNANIGGLPFASSGTYASSGAFAYYANFAAGLTAPLMALTNVGATTAALWMGTAPTVTRVTDVMVQSNSDMLASFVYMTA